MKHFIVYDKTSGTILRTGICPDSMFNIQVLNENEGVVEGDNDVRSNTHQINLKTLMVKEREKQ